MSSRSLSMPTEAAPPPRGGMNGGKRSDVYVPLPKGRTASGVGKNVIYATLFSPARWPIHTGNLKPGLVHPDVLPAPRSAQEIWTYYWKFHGHFVKNPADPEGNLFILCPKEINRYYRDVLKLKPLFLDERCPLCGECSAWWNKYDDAWKQVLWNGAPVDRNARKAMSKETFKAISEQHPQIKQIGEEAKEWQAKERILTVVFDLDKMNGRRPLDEGEQGVAYQLWPAPDTAFKALTDLKENRVEFWSLDNPCQLLVTKDCTHGGRFAKYTVSNIGPFQPDEATRKYLEDEASLPVLSVGTLEEAGQAFALALTYDQMVGLLAQVKATPRATGLPQAPAAPPPFAPTGAPAPGYGAQPAPYAPSAGPPPAYTPPVAPPPSAVQVPPPVRPPQGATPAPGAPGHSSW
jgi:hypothetical protein